MIADYPSLSRLAPAEEPSEAMEETMEMESASLDNRSTSGEAH
jgi:hypothetical protein